MTLELQRGVTDLLKELSTLKQDFAKLQKLLRNYGKPTTQEDLDTLIGK